MYWFYSNKYDDKIHLSNRSSTLNYGSWIYNLESSMYVYSWFDIRYWPWPILLRKKHYFVNKSITESCKLEEFLFIIVSKPSNLLQAVSAYKKRLYKKRLVDGLKVKKRTLVDFYKAKKRSSYLHSQNLLS